MTTANQVSIVTGCCVCISLFITLTLGGASNGGRALAQTHLPVNDPGLLLLVPLAVLALSGRKGKRQRWATLAAAILLAVAAMGRGATLPGDDNTPVAAAMQPISTSGENNRRVAVQPLDNKGFAPQLAAVVNA
jgi:hypothetical protein